MELLRLGIRGAGVTAGVVGVREDADGTMGVEFTEGAGIVALGETVLTIGSLMDNDEEGDGDGS